MTNEAALEQTDRVIGELRAGIVRQLRLAGVRPEDIDPDAPLFVEGLALDSIDAIELVVLLEHQYGLKLQDSRKARDIIHTVRSMAEYVVAEGKASRA